MNRYQLRYFLCALLFPLFLVSCGKDDDEDVSPNVALLTAGKWTGNAIYLDGDNVTNEVLEDFGFDITDDSFVFTRAGEYTESYGGQDLDGTWVYENNERVIVFDKGTNDEFTAVISKLDEDEFSYVAGSYEFRYRRN